MKYLILLALLVSYNACADLYLTLGGWSKHTRDRYEYQGQKYDFNNNHQAVIVDYKGFTLGTFENSYHKTTNFIGYTKREDNLSFTVAYGTGYRDIHGGCRVKLGKECLLITAAYSLRPVKLSLMGDALALSFEFKLY